VKRLLYVDSDSESCLLMSDLLSPHTVDIVASDAEARRAARRQSYDIYVVSGGGPGSTGLSLCAWLHRVDPRTPIVFCSSNGTAQYQKLALAAGALRYQVKPIDPTLLRSTMGLLLKLAEIESTRAMAAAEHALEDELVKMYPQVHEPDTAVRVQGETYGCRLQARAYRAFRDAGGNRANFERLWPNARDRVEPPRA
jgi:DNA-binding response OmpR family regulator